MGTNTALSQAFRFDLIQRDYRDLNLAIWVVVIVSESYLESYPGLSSSKKRFHVLVIYVQSFIAIWNYWLEIFKL